MPFNIALSGIRAANDDLRITGNNIANASTTGFKESRAEFGDIYSTTVLGAGLNQVGSGVRVQSVSQQFSQGNVSFTENVLDLAVNGSGFFVTNTNGEQGFTRSGTFSLDKDGFVVNNIDGRLQGFIADGIGNIGTLPADIQIETTNLQPQATTNVEVEVNVDARAIPPQSAFTIDAAGIAAIEAAGVDTIGITNPDGFERFITVGTDDSDPDTPAIDPDTPATIAAAITEASGVEATVNADGEIEIILDIGYSLTTNSAGNDLATAATTSLTSGLGFDSSDPSTYNHSTAVTVFDSQGVPHTMQKYFIKQPFDPSTEVIADGNRWQMVVEIDGNNVGPSTDTTDLLTSFNTAQPAIFDLKFNSDGGFDEITTGDINIDNWIPVDSNGIPTSVNGPAESNFLISMGESSQVGGAFEVRSVSQDGTATGRLAGINIDDEGVIFARYTNGQSRVLAQVVLADFANTQGLQSVGDTGWAETSESGEPVIGGPGTAALGLIQSGALEDSNVDLSEQLVNLIIAQRNYQANAKTIETADQTTQTIINLR